MVSIGTLIGIGAIGLVVFFREDISTALGNLKGFGSEFGRDFGKVPDINLPDITINVPDFGIPKAFADTGEVAEEAGAVITTALTETGEAIREAGVGAREVIFEAGVSARKDFDKTIEEAQANFEQFGKDVETNIGIIGEGLTSIFGGLFPSKEMTTVSEAVPTITSTSRRAGTETRFGGQTAPKEVLTKETASTPELIISEQPDLSLVSPFLKSFQTVEEKPEEIIQPISLSGRRR